MSDFINEVLKEKIELNNITKSQSQFIELFDLAFEQCYEKYHKQLMLVLNKNNFNSEWLVKQNDLFYKHLKIPQTREEIKTTFTQHPITEITKENVLKEIRHLSSIKHNE